MKWEAERRAFRNGQYVEGRVVGHNDWEKYSMRSHPDLAWNAPQMEYRVANIPASFEIAISFFEGQDRTITVEALNLKVAREKVFKKLTSDEMSAVKNMRWVEAPPEPKSFVDVFSTIQNGILNTKGQYRCLLLEGKGEVLRVSIAHGHSLNVQTKFELDQEEGEALTALLLQFFPAARDMKV